MTLGLVAVLAFAVASGFAVWWLLVRGPTKATEPTSTQGNAIAISQGGLETLASLGRPIYWAGPRAHETYELTQAPGGRAFVRYLPSGTPVGSSGIYLTVATYPVGNAFAATRRVATQAGVVKVSVGHGGIAFYRTRLPTNIYLAYPGSGYQIEVFDPSPAEALQLVKSGAIAQVHEQSQGITVPKTAAVAVSAADLAKLQTRLGRNLYWAGSEVGATYELTQTPDGRVYVRYLPASAKVGTPHLYLTIGTYPLADAYATTKSAAAKPDAVDVPIAGGVAFYDRSRPMSVYIAFPGVDEQIEVFDPSAEVAHSTVARHLIRAVS
ncbi:MAG TPA: hypothetical protein VH063_14070 [Gaiellaceae bacterium]|nr:hypothetical protein [Gaiellaceae bacterium]